MFAVDLRNEILRRKQKNRALGQRRKLLEQWASVYPRLLQTPGKDHRGYARQHWRHIDEIRCLTLEIDLNGAEISRLRLLLKFGSDVQCTVSPTTTAPDELDCMVVKHKDVGSLVVNQPY